MRKELEVVLGWCKVCVAISRIGRETGRCRACGSPHVSLRRPEAIQTGESA
jgi:hypothetical protein